MQRIDWLCNWIWRFNKLTEKQVCIKILCTLNPPLEKFSFIANHIFRGGKCEKFNVNAGDFFPFSICRHMRRSTAFCGFIIKTVAAITSSCIGLGSFFSSHFFCCLGGSKKCIIAFLLLLSSDFQSDLQQQKKTLPLHHLKGYAKFYVIDFELGAMH